MKTWQLFLIGAILTFTSSSLADQPGHTPLPLENALLTPFQAAWSEEPAPPRMPAGQRPLPEWDVFVRPPRDTMHVSLEVLVEGRPLRTTQYAGKTYLLVPRTGMEYEIRVWNLGPRRITAIVSVDGLSVINGRLAATTHPGYIVSPQEHLLIKGWRRNLETVAAFSFEEREKSYASLMGRPENVGVIGLVAFEEQARRPLEHKDHPLALLARSAHAEVGNTGTGYGRTLDSAISYVPFVRSDNKRSLTLYYDTVENLSQQGIPVDGPFPVPFPGANRLPSR